MQVSKASYSPAVVNTEVFAGPPGRVLSALVKPLSNLLKDETKQSVKKNAQATMTDSVEESLRGKEVVFFLGTLSGHET